MPQLSYQTAGESHGPALVVTVTGLPQGLEIDESFINAELARRLSMAPSAVFERVKRLEQKGVIKGYGAHVDPRAIERSLLAYVLHDFPVAR